MMEFVNLAFKNQKSTSLESASKFLLVLAPFAPHIAEELWQQIGKDYSIHKQAWPKYDPNELIDREVTIIVQVDGKLRASFVAKQGSLKEELTKSALKLEAIKRWTVGHEVKNVIVIADKLVNIVL